MSKENDFSKTEKPYAHSPKRQITINLDGDTVDYFKHLAEKMGIPYQTLINLYLTDCAKSGKGPKLIWE